jgi:hypothetical protein
MAWQSIWSCPWIAMMLAVLDWSDCGGVCRAKVGNCIREGCLCVVVGRHHVVAVLTCRDGGKRCNLDCFLPE